MKIQKADPELQTAAESGYDAQKNKPTGVYHVSNPHLYSSDMWLAWQCGAYMFANGYGRPEGVRKSRGHSIRANGFIFKFDSPFWEVRGA
jgi:hypothetical protein